MNTIISTVDILPTESKSSIVSNTSVKMVILSVNSIANINNLIFNII